MPAVIPSFKFFGTLFTKVSLNFTNERSMNTTPSTNIAANATFQGSCIPAFASSAQTVYEKYAFNPIPDANATG